MDKQVLIAPITTERSTAFAKSGFYTFAVSQKMRKGEIKKAIEDQFQVNVVEIRTIRMPGKKRRKGKYMREVSSPSWKKAIVKIKKDQKIPIFEVG